MEAITTAAAVAYVGAKVDKALEEPIKRLSKHFCDTCIEKKRFSKINKEINQDDFLKDYIINSYNEIGRTKTLLHRYDNQLIEDFCINTDLTYKSIKNKEITIKTDEVQNLLDLSHKIIITGLGGMGKTIMMKFMHINCIKQLDLIPVFITLRNIPVTHRKKIIFKSVKKSLTQYGAKMSDELIEESLQKGCYLILFDGFDEIKSDISGTIAKAIMKFSRKYNNNYFVVSSRPSDEYISWSDFKEFHCEPMTKKQALALIDKIEFDAETKNDFKNELEIKYYDEHESFASNPLLLTIMFKVYSINGDIPDDFCDFYAKAFTVMFYEHDKNTKNHIREIHSRLTQSELQHLFEHFCFKTFFKQKYSFKENELIEFIENSIKKLNTNAEPYAVLKDLSENLCMLVKEGLEYKFVHRSFQEYFAAIYTKNLTDSEQKKLLCTFIEKNSNIIKGSEYFPILVKLDGERFYKNVISDMLDEIEEIYNSVGQDDCKFWAKIIDRIRGCTDVPIIFAGFSKYIYEALYYLIHFYPEYQNINFTFSFILKKEAQIAKIINEKGKLTDSSYYKIINTAELIEICERTGKKDEIMEIFQPDIDIIKSLFQNRLYQESSIDDLLDTI